MNNDLLNIIDESIKLELNASELYYIFYENYIEDSDFWWELHMEEKNHASLLRSIKEFFVPYNKIPEDLVVDNLRLLKETNKEIEDIIEYVKKAKPSRLAAFTTALKLEQSAAETHFQNFMEGSFGEKFEEVIRRLNREDRNHYLRIKNYMEEHSI